MITVIKLLTNITAIVWMHAIGELKTEQKSEHGRIAVFQLKDGTLYKVAMDIRLRHHIRIYI